MTKVCKVHRDCRVHKVRFGALGATGAHLHST
jgi:hypothetical protein